MERLVLDGGTVAWGPGLDARPGPLVLDGPRIAPGGTTGRRIDCRGLTLLPGFIDAHVHIGFFAPHDVLAGGVTTVRDLGWPSAVIFELARASRAAGFDGPQVLAVGEMLTAPGGYPTRAAWAPPGTGREVSGEGEARAAVAELAERGAAAIKVALNPPAGPVLDDDTLAAVISEAHARGLRVTGHVHGLDQLRRALRHGLDELAHMVMGPETIPADVIEDMVRAGLVTVPTLACRGDERAAAVANLRAFHAAGGRVVYGTDLGNDDVRPGIDPGEVAAMAAAGMDGRAIVRAATVGAAAWLGLDDRGVLAPGRRSDVVGVRGDPFDDPAALAAVELVVRAGRPVRTPGR